MVHASTGEAEVRDIGSILKHRDEFYDTHWYSETLSLGSGGQGGQDGEEEEDELNEFWKKHLSMAGETYLSS